MTQLEALFESYATLEDASSAAVFTDEVSQMKDDELVRLFLTDYERRYQEWAQTPLEALQGKTPAAYVQSLESAEEIWEVFVKAAEVLNPVPKLFRERMAQEAGFFEQKLMQVFYQEKDATDIAYWEFVSDCLEVFGALGSPKTFDVFQYLQEKVRGTEMEDWIFERVNEVGRSIGAVLTEPLLYQLSGRKHFSAVEVNGLRLLADIGNAAPDQRILPVLKDAFRTYEAPGMLAQCFTSLGDGRAVVFLRGWLDKKAKTLDMFTFSEVYRAISELGGQTEDLHVYDFLSPEALEALRTENN